MKTLTSLPAILTGAALILLTAIPVHAQTKTPAAALLAKTKVAYADAKKTALQAVPGATVKKSELENEDGGLRWSFDLTTPGGKIVENKVENAKDEADEEKEEKKEHHKKQD